MTQTLLPKPWCVTFYDLKFLGTTIQYCFICSFLSLYPPHCASIHFSHVPHSPSCSCIQKRGGGGKGDEVSGVGCVGGEWGEKWGAGETTNPRGEHCSIPTPQVTALHPSLHPSCPASLSPLFFPSLPSFTPLTPVPLTRLKGTV